LILIDANIFMYAAGAEHPHKTPSVDFLRRLDGREVYAFARRIVPLVVAITDQFVDRARDLLDNDPRLGARDALHAAVVLGRGMDAICSYDRDLDKIIGLQRIEPPAP
jgi:predicted nucleic acid-binding protein